MKTITCREMGGVCDAPITGDSPEDMHEKGKAHVRGATDPEHQALAEKMKTISDEELKAWEGEFQKTWDKTPDDK